MMNDHLEKNVENEPVATESSVSTPVNNTSDAPATSPEVLPVPEEEKTPYDAFDWSLDKRNKKSYSESEKNDLDNLYDGSYPKLENRKVVEGTIVGVADSNLIISVGAKSDGLVPLSEFKDYEGELKIGDKIPILVVEKEDAKGNIVLSYKETKAQESWERIIAAYESQEIVVGQVVEKSKGGLIVNLFDINVFLPGSQIDVKVVTDYDQYLNKRMEFKIIKLNENIRNAVISHKAIIEGKIEEQRAGIIEKLEKGQVVEGVVKNITDFGVFMDLGNVDGLLYITDISWKRIAHPSEMFHVDQRVNVVVLDFDHTKKRISLGLKQLTPHPWEAFPEDIKEGSVLEGKAVNIEDYGAFLEVADGVEGLVHVSEISWSNAMINSKEYFKVGEKYKVKVISLDKEQRKMSLSIKQLDPDPWLTIGERFPEGSKHKGEVKNITNYGVFVEMKDGFGGMIHISDLSWTKRISHPKEFLKLGDVLDVIVLKVDQENRKILLGHKQVEANPWDLLRDVFAVGTVHQAKVTKKKDVGAIVELAHGIEGFVPARHLLTQDNKALLVGETTDFAVVEFDADEKKVILSHRRTWELKQESDDKESANEQHEVRRKIAAQNKMEKSVLGDIGQLSDLRQKLKDEGEAKPASEEKPSAKTEEKASKRKKTDDDTPTLF